MKNTKRTQPTAVLVVERETSLKGITLALGAIVTLAVVAVFVAFSSGHAGENSAPVFVKEIPPGYRDWKLISVAREEGDLDDIRAILGNDIAIKAYREGQVPFPDGAIVAALHWNEVSSEENNNVLAKGFPGAGIQSFVPGPAVNMQFMIKDSKKYATTGGWGFGDFTNGKPGSVSLMKTCFTCHVPAKDHDFVFTRYAP